MPEQQLIGTFDTGDTIEALTTLDLPFKDLGEGKFESNILIISGDCKVSYVDISGENIRVSKNYFMIDDNFKSCKSNEKDLTCIEVTNQLDDTYSISNYDWAIGDEVVKTLFESGSLYIYKTEEKIRTKVDFGSGETKGKLLGSFSLKFVTETTLKGEDDDVTVNINLVDVTTD